MRGTVAIALVVAALASACTSGDGGSPEPAGAAPAASTSTNEREAPLVPESFVARAAPFRVVLSWQAPPEEVDRYELFRDGQPLATQSGSATSFVDKDVVPGQIYNYEIAAQTGDLVSGRLHQSVETPTPALRAARLEGTFNITTRFTSKSGYGDYTPPNFGWRFIPRCGQRACDVVLRDIHERGFRVRLDRRGARYRGTYTGPFTIECEGSGSTSTVKIAVRIAAAAAIDGAWLATRIRGTIEHSEVAQFGCRAAEATLALRGRLPR
jgi:hypothetical protein